MEMEPPPGYDLRPSLPTLSDDAIDRLNQFRVSDLQTLASNQGKSTSGNKVDLAYRIANRNPPNHRKKIEYKHTPNTQEGIAARISELKQFDLNDLKERCRELELSYSGSKDDLSKKIAKWEAKASSSRQQLAEINQFRHPKGYSSTAPEINQKYKDDFNLVDRFNRRLSDIAHEPKIASEMSRVLISIVEFSLVQAWAVCLEWNYEGEETEKRKSLPLKKRFL